MDKRPYETPEMRLIGVDLTPPICLSGNSGTENVGKSGSPLYDSDFD